MKHYVITKMLTINFYYYFYLRLLLLVKNFKYGLVILMVKLSIRPNNKNKINNRYHKTIFKILNRGLIDEIMRLV